MSDARDIVINSDRKILNGLRHLIVHKIRNKIIDDSLARVELKFIAVDEEPAVTVAAPTPIEVEQAVVVIAMANKGMTAIFALTRVLQRDMLVDVRLQQRHPFIIGIAALADVRGLVGIGEIVADGNRNIRRIGA